MFRGVFRGVKGVLEALSRVFKRVVLVKGFLMGFGGALEGFNGCQKVFLQSWFRV